MTDLIDILKFRTESSMNTKYFMLNDSGKRHHVEHLIEHFPVVNSNSLFALFIKSEKSIHIRCLVMTSEKKNVFRESHLVGKKQDNALNGHRPSVNIVSKEKIVDLSRIP